VLHRNGGEFKQSSGINGLLPAGAGPLHLFRLLPEFSAVTVAWSDIGFKKINISEAG